MPLTCINCQVSFENSEAHRIHYKSEWHKYNLKRKIAEFPTVTYEEFQDRASVYHQRTAEIADRRLTCKLCHKNFSSENALSSHVKSKKHLEVCGKGSTSTSELVENVKNRSIGETKSQPSTVLLDKAKGDDVEFSYPVSEHSVESDVDISEECDDDDDDDDWESIDDEEDAMPMVPTNICIFCNSESENTESNVQHMKISHSFYIPDCEYLINLDGLLCYLGQKVTFGFTCLCCNAQKRSVKSVQQHMIDKGHCRMLFEGESAMEEYEDFYNYSASYPDQLRNENEEVDVNILDSNGYQLVLPSGSTIGHRSLAMYYRQNLPPARAVARKTDKIMNSYRALCQSGNFGKMPFYRTSSYKHAVQRQRKSTLKLGVKQNKFQPHFRSQIMF